MHIAPTWRVWRGDVDDHVVGVLGQLSQANAVVLGSILGQLVFTQVHAQHAWPAAGGGGEEGSRGSEGATFGHVALAEGSAHFGAVAIVGGGGVRWR